MASGVEMLGQMSETDALAGPVQGGNMVVKPNEVPVGGAAMLAKALRGQSNKGIGGIYELPSQEPKTPEFMQMAKAGLQERDPMRGQGPRRGLTPFDRANMEGAAMQAGIINFLGGQPEVTAPIRAQSHADAPPTELAYITAAEKQMLLDANLHGSLENNQPNPGPAGIQSLDDFYNLPGGGIGGGSGEQVFSSGVDSGQQSTGNEPGGGGYQSSEAYGIGAGQAVGGGEGGTGGTVFTQNPNDPTGNWSQVSGVEQEAAELVAQQEQLEQLNLLQNINENKNENKNKNKKQQEFLQNQIDAEKKLIADGKGNKNRLKNLVKRLQEIPKTNIGTTLIDKGKELSEDVLEQLKKMGLIGKKVKDIDDLPKGTQKEMFDLLGKFERFDGNLLESFAQQMSDRASLLDGKENLERKDKDGKVIGDTLEGLTKKLRALDTGGGASVLQSLKKYAPELHYKAFREPQTSGGLESFARNTLAVKDAEGNYKVDGRAISNEDAKRYNNAIFSARERSRDRQGGNNQQAGRPVVMQDTMIDEVIDTPAGVVDEASNTMEYSGPSTGGTTQTVPLNKRFTTDPTTGQYTNQPRSAEDIYQYYSQGTSGPGNMMEPWEEYQKRRRKALGLEPLGLYTG